MGAEAYSNKMDRNRGTLECKVTPVSPDTENANYASWKSTMLFVDILQDLRFV